jgi:hypothetical protein
MVMSELIVDTVTITNLTRQADSNATFLRSVADSVILFNNFEISDIDFKLFIMTDSFLTMTNTSLVNIKASYRIIEAYRTSLSKT